MTARWKRRILISAVVVAAACLFHAPLLRGLANFLVVDEPTRSVDYICVTSWGYRPDGDRCYDVAGELHRKNPSCRILLIEPNHSRLVQIGAVKSFASVSQRELGSRGVPSEAISILRCEPWNDWATARALADWLRDHPNNSVLLLCGQFRSAQARHTLDAVLHRAEAARVRVRALPSRQCDETDWWTSRRGYLEFGDHWLMRIQNRLGGGDAMQPPERNAEQYERDFLRTLPEALP